MNKKKLGKDLINEIKFEKLKRLDYLIDSFLPTIGWTCVDTFTRNLKELDKLIPGSGERYIYKLTHKDEECIYSEKFVEQLLKEQFIKRTQK